MISIKKSIGLKLLQLFNSIIMMEAADLDGSRYCDMTSRVQQTVLLRSSAKSFSEGFLLRTRVRTQKQINNSYGLTSPYTF
jgi:hypothetical protein